MPGKPQAWYIPVPVGSWSPGYFGLYTFNTWPLFPDRPDWLTSSTSTSRLPTAMRTMVASVVMVMCMMLVCADVKPKKEFNAQRFTGRWYRVGLAYDSPSFVPYRDKLKASMGVITLLPNGNVNLTMWDATPLGCLRQLYQYERTSVPGQFTYFSTRHNMVKDITVVDTNYHEYAVVLKHKVFNREYTQVALYGRSQRVRIDVIQKFKAFALSRGFPRESILTPPPSENCPPPGTPI